ncbi:hypothetical protein D3C83_47650 [compost metagenome]
MHDLLLKNRHSERPPEDPAYLVIFIGNFFRLHLPALEIGMHHVALDWSRPDDGDLDDEIVKILRLQARQHGHLRA